MNETLVTHLKRKHRYLLSVLSGVLLVLSFPFTGSLTLVGFIALVPLLLVEASISNQNYRSRKVFLHAYITFFIYNVGATWWVYFASAEGAVMAFFANSLLMALVFYAFHLTKKYIGNKEGYIGLIIYWIAFEYFHYNWESSWPWLSLGNIFSILPSWVQWYSYTGVLGGSLWVLIINLLVFRTYQNVLFRNETWKVQTSIFYLAGTIFVIPLTISLISYFTYQEKSNPIEVVAVQPNIDPYEKWDFDVKGQVDELLNLAKKKVSPKTKLIVAPETALSGEFDQNGNKIHHSLNEADFHVSYMYHYLKEHQREMYNVPILVGASTYRVFNSKHSHASRPIGFDGQLFLENYNTSLLMYDDQLDYIHKSKLVPGVEKIPFSAQLPFLEDLSIDLGGTTGTLGIEKEPKIFEIEGLKIAPSICYESAFGEFIAEQCRKGAQLICIGTNDGWWQDTPGYRQHCSFASLRAIENRRSVVRSANTGTSCFVNQRGDILQPTEWWVPDVIKGNVNLNDEQSFYTMYGDVLGRSFAFVSVLLLLYTAVKWFRKLVSKT